MTQDFKQEMVVEGDAADLLQSGNALVRLENTTQMTIAVQRPRNETQVLASALATLATYPDAAEEAVYNKPVGFEGGKQNYAEGLSVRAAEDLMQRWGNCAAGVDIVEVDGDNRLVTGVFCDYERNVRIAIPRRVSAKYKQSAKKGGAVVTRSPEMFDQVTNAEVSKALREAVLRGLPAGLKKAYMQKAKEIIGKGAKDNSKTITSLVSAFGEHGVSAGVIERHLGHPCSDITPQEVVELRGIYNAIHNMESSPDEAFGAAMVEPLKGTKGRQKLANAFNTDKIPDDPAAENDALDDGKAPWDGAAGDTK